MEEKKLDELLAEGNAMEQLAEYVLFMSRCSGDVKEAVEHQRPMTAALYKKCTEELESAGAEAILRRFRAEFGDEYKE